MASEAVYVDLDLKGNSLLKVGDALVPTSAPNLAQVESLITTGGWTPSAAATAAGLGLTSTGSTIDVAAGRGLGVDETGLWVDPGTAIDTTDGVSVKYGTGIALELAGDAVADTLAVDQAWLQIQIETLSQANLTEGNGIDITGDVVTAVADPAGIATVGTAGIYVPASAAATVTSVAATPTETTVDVAGTVFTVGLDDAITGAISGNTAAIALKADKATTLTAGAGLTGGGTLGAATTFDVGATPSGGIAVAADGIGIAPGGVTGGMLATEAVGNINLGANLYGLIDVQRLTTDPASAQDGYVLTYRSADSQWIGATPATVDYPVENILGTTGQITVTENADVFTVGLDTAITTAITANTNAIAAETTARTDADAALQGEVNAVEGDLAQEILDRAAADTTINTRIDGITVTGTGAAVVTETTTDNFLVHVESLSLSNTYTGTATNSAEIDAELGAGVAEAGDLYINTETGAAFIYTGTEWVALATATAGLNSIAAADASVTVNNGAGPAATIAVSPALQTAISTATTTNTAQDTAIGLLQTSVTALELIDHPAATGANAIAVSGAQAVSLVIDPASASVLTQSATGLNADLSGFVTDTELTTAVTALEGADTALAGDIADEVTRATAAEGALDARLTTEEGVNNTQDDDIAALELSQAAQDTAIASKAVAGSAPLTTTPGTPVAIAGIPALATVNVVDDLGCQATIQVCGFGAAGRTFDSNVPFTGTVYWVG